MAFTFLFLLGIFSFLPGSNNNEDPVYEKLKEIAHNDTDESISFLTDTDFLPPGKELVQIMVVRHGQPALEKKKLYTWREAQAYIEAYDTVGVEEFISNISLPSTLDRVYTSTLERARHTAEIICQERQLIQDMKFREFERSIPRIPLLKAPIDFWLVAARVPWLLGTTEVENFRQAMDRSKEVADYLSIQASENEKAMLVAHGFLNHRLASELQNNGWYQVKSNGNGFLSTALYVKVQDKKDREQNQERQIVEKQD